MEGVLCSAWEDGSLKWLRWFFEVSAVGLHAWFFAWFFEVPGAPWKAWFFEVATGWLLKWGWFFEVVFDLFQGRKIGWFYELWLHRPKVGKGSRQNRSVTSGKGLALRVGCRGPCSDVWAEQKLLDALRWIVDSCMARIAELGMLFRAFPVQ